MDQTANEKAARKVGLVRYLCERFDLDPEAAAFLVDDYPEVLEVAGADYEAMLGALAVAALHQNVRTKAVLRDVANSSAVQTPYQRAKAPEPSKVMYGQAGRRCDAQLITDPVEWW